MSTLSSLLHSIKNHRFNHNRVADSFMLVPSGLRVKCVHDLSDDIHNLSRIVFPDALVQDAGVLCDGLVHGFFDLFGGHNLTDKAQVLSDRAWCPLVTVDDLSHHHPSVDNRDLGVIDHLEQFGQLPVAEGVGNSLLEVFALGFAVGEDVLVYPLVDGLGVNLEGPDQAREHLDAPWVPEHVLHIRDIHTELVSEAALDFEWNLAEDPVHGGYSFVRD